MPDAETSSARPTPEAILGVLGKLRRTLSKNVAEQKEAPSPKGLIKAVDVPDSGPNLLRPSPGLMSVSSKTELPSERSLNMAGLESAAPPVELDRPTRPRVQQPVPAQSETVLSGTALSAVPVGQASNSADLAGSAGLSDLGLNSAQSVSSTQAVHTSARTDGGMDGGTLDHSEDANAALELGVAEAFSQGDPITTDAVTDLDSSRVQVAPVSADATATAYDGSPIRSVSKPDKAVSPEVQLVSPAVVAVSPQKAPEQQAAALDKDLDAVIEELSMELSHLQPSSGTQQAQQGSYLQRHTSSVVLKIAQEASNPPLPAVAMLAQSSADHAAQPASPRQASKPREAQQAKHALKNMAASLKRAYDEGRLRERSPAPVPASEDKQAGNQATLRTFRPAAKSLKDYNPPAAQHNPSPNLTAASSGYAALTASMRRSISPKAAAHAAPLDKRPAWDASPPPRRTPQHAQHALQDSNADLTANAEILSQLSNVSAQQAQHEVEQSGQLQVSSERPKPLSPAESAALAVATLLSTQQSASPVRRSAPANTQTHLGHRKHQPSALPTAASLQHPRHAATSLQSLHDASSADHAMLPSDAAFKPGTSGRVQRTTNSSKSTDQGLLQPAWVSPSQHRRSSSSQQPSPLRRSTGSRTLPPPKATAAATAPHVSDAMSTPSQSASASDTLQQDRQLHESVLQSDAAQLDARSPSLIADLRADAHSLAHAQALQRLHQAVQGYKHPAQGFPNPTVQPPIAATPSDEPQLDAGSLSIAADIQADAASLAHAEALQRLQQAVQEYKSSSANVLVPAAVQLAAALRRASRATGEPMPTIESLQLAGLKLKHEAGLDGSEDVPKSPWPDWVKGAWGSPRGPKRDRPGMPVPGSKQFEPAGVASGSVQVKRDVQTRAAQQAQQAQLSGPVTRSHADEQVPNANWSPVKVSVTQPARRSTLVQRALSEAAAAAAAARVVPKARARATTTPPRRPPVKKLGEPAQADARGILPGSRSKSAARDLPGRTVSNSRTAAVAASKAQVGSRKAPRKPVASSQVKTREQSVPRQIPAAIHTQAQATAPALHAVPEAASVSGAAHSDGFEPEAEVSTSTDAAASDTHTAAGPAAAPNATATHALDTSAACETGQDIVPVHSSTSVAALRTTFERQASHVDSIKPLNRLPLRKVTSKAHVITGDSPQEAALAWQQSLRDVHDPSSSHQSQLHAVHAVRQLAGTSSADQPKHAEMEIDTLAGNSHCVPTSSAPGLAHTMSALVSQRKELPQSASVQQKGADQATEQSTAQQVAQSSLTEATLAAVDSLRTSAEKLPVSHRLTVTRSTFDSDQGSLVSMDSKEDEEDDMRSEQHGFPDVVSHPLREEATLALLPDRGMSPVSEAAGEGAFTEGRAVSWKGLRWAHGPSWVRVVCRLAPSPTPHFIHSQGPHTLQANLGRHGADAKQFSFDQVLTEDSSPEEVAAEAEGLVQAVLQGHNSVVMALGQSGSGKTHTMAGDTSPLDRTRTRTPGLNQVLVEQLFSQLDEGQVAAQVQSVHMTAFQIQDERIQDLLQPQPVSNSPRHVRRTGSTGDKHDVFVDKEKRTWVSNLAAIQIMSPSDYDDMAELIATRRSSSSSAHTTSHGARSFIITLLVTADLPSTPASHGSLPSSARGQTRNSPSAVGADSARLHHMGPHGQNALQRGNGRPTVQGTVRSCIKLSFVEVGSAAPEARQAARRRVSAEPLQHMQLSRTSTSLSSFMSMSSTASSRWAMPGSGTSPRWAGVGAGKGQDITMRAVAEVVWAAAHGKGVPVPHRQCKLTRYLQDTLHPQGRAVAIVCIDPAADDLTQSCSMATLSVSERMMLP